MNVKNDVDVFSPYSGFQSTLLLITIIGLYAFLQRRKKRSANLPPGPRGWPILGNLPSLTLHSEDVFFEWNREYGPVCRLKMASLDFILLGNIEAVQEAFVKKADIFSDRMQNSLVGMSGNHGIAFLNYTQKLKRQRRFGLTTLREFGMGRKLVEPIILDKCKSLCNRIETCCKTDKTIALHFMVYETVSGIISELVFNKDLPTENKEFNDFIRLLMTGTKYSALNGLLIFYPNLKKFPPFCWGFQETIEMEKTTHRLLSEQVEFHKNTRNPNEPRDFIDCFLSEMDDFKKSKEKEHGFSEEQLISTLRDLFYAGSETSATALCWIILYLSREKEIQNRLYQEISNVLGSDEQPSMSFADRMPYARAIIQETLRLRPVAPVGLPHVAAREGTILGYRISKGAVIAANIYRIHHDENLWPDAEIFKPQRHIDSNGKFMKSQHIIPFSVGARQCLGLQLANMELFLVTVSLFQKYELSLFNPDEVNMCGENVFVLRPSSFKITVTKR